MTASKPDDATSLRALCTRFLPGHLPCSPAEELAAMAAWCREHDVDSDIYGRGDALQALEADIAARLGMAAAVFMPSGTMAQQIALRIACERSGRRRVAFHPTSHLELHEQRAYDRLHGLSATLIGVHDHPTLARDLAALSEPPAALLVELPLREIGGQLPTWDELEELVALASERGVHLHLDGARLWETRTWFGGKTCAEICRGFDSVYVSMYKGVGAIAGAFLAGSESLVDEARIWLRRHGGNLVRSYPFVVSAAMNLAERLDAMPAWVDHARALARGLAELPFVRIRPDPPHINMFHLYLDRPGEALLAARDEIARLDRLWLFSALRPCNTPGWSASEIYVGSAAMKLGVAEVVAAFSKLGELARPPGQSRARGR